ncbi:hypothetical protein E2562_006417 [Oryza meyeriana var. granulata]|uniref:Uncharacterized protein n=1 Tax=Oryza meyeriana var. granulata TaxID=110450 RepID=A0A6G1EEM7_9ORYZ|nr:hypothetical protein E2562_006417 [Oryza meyeriana var. granulata]
MAPGHDAIIPHVVLLPSAGHVVPAAQLVARLAADHGCTATIVRYTNVSTARHSSALASLPRGVTATALPEVPLDDLPADARNETRVFTVVSRTLPHLRELLRSLLFSSPSGVAAFLTDMLCPAALAVAAELGVPRYVFLTSNLMCLVSLLYTPEIDRTTAGEFRDLPEPIILPGTVPPVYPLMVELCLDYLRPDSFLSSSTRSSFDAMEHETLVAFKELSHKGVYPPAYAVGPFVRPCSGETANENDACIRGGPLSREQTAELAAGLEASGQRFLWVVRFPSDKDKSASYFGMTDHGDADDLPEGFLETTKGAGLTVLVVVYVLVVLYGVVVRSGSYNVNAGFSIACVILSLHRVCDPMS